MTQRVNQKDFHSMRGHVAEGTVIHMENGDIVELKAVMKGWQLYKGSQPCAEPTNSAFIIECLVDRYPEVRP